MNEIDPFAESSSSTATDDPPKKTGKKRGGGKKRPLDRRIEETEQKLAEMKRLQALGRAGKDPLIKKVASAIKNLRFVTSRMPDNELRAACTQAALNLEAALTGQKQIP